MQFCGHHSAVWVSGVNAVLDKLCTSQEAVHTSRPVTFVPFYYPSFDENLALEAAGRVTLPGLTVRRQLLRPGRPLTLGGIFFRVPVLGAEHVCGLSYAQPLMVK